MIDSQSKKFLYQYLNNNAPVGYEINGQEIWLNYIKKYVDETFVDVYGTAVAVINPKAPYKVVIEAHADEIAWYINYINKDGYMYVVRNGGSDYQIAPSMRAKIHTENAQTFPAVFGWPAIHVRHDKEKPKPDIESIVLDAGFSSDKEIRKAGIDVGDVVTFDQDFTEINDFFVGRALDNRIGGFTIAQVARKLSTNKDKLPFGLYIVNAVQEEVGLKGARMIAERIKPDLAVVTDVTHDTCSPLYSKVRDGDVACGKGPVISYAASIQNNLRKRITRIAEKHKIPIQKTASATTGTDTESFAYSGPGIPSALISIPLKYMHTTVEMVHRKDVEKAINLYYHFLKELPAGHTFSYF